MKLHSLMPALALALAACGGGETSEPPSASSSAASGDSPAALGDTARATAQAAPNGNWTAAGKIYSNGQRFEMRGVNWYGIEEAGAPGGSWTIPVDTFVGRIASLGFNTIRLPVSHETVQPGFLSTYEVKVSDNAWARKNSIDLIWDVVKSARARGVAVVLDYQTCKNTLISENLPAKPYGGPCGIDRNGWLNDLRKLADIAAANPNVMGVDIYNEPRYGGDEYGWMNDAKAAADAIHGIAPGTLVFVSGLEQANNWGEDLRFALRPNNPLNDYNGLQKIVYSAHIYQINASDNPVDNWNQTVKAVRDAGKTVVIGEFGFNPGSAWGRNLVNWLKANDLRDTLYWAINADTNSLGLITDYNGATGGATKPQYDVVRELFGGGAGGDNPPTGGLLPLNQVRSFQVTNGGLTNRYLRHQDGLARTDVVDGGSNGLLKADASFRIVAGLADSACYSFEARNYPGQFLRHQNFRLKLAGNDNSALFRSDATFCARNGLAGVGVSLEAKGLPGSYLRHFNSEVWLGRKNGSNPGDGNPGAFDQDASWNVVNAWAP